MNHSKKKMMGGGKMKKDGNALARREPAMYGGMKKMKKGGMNRIQYMEGGPVMDNIPMAKPN